MTQSKKVVFKKIYEQLWKAFGPQHWWPAKTKFEVIIGAILTQNTNWTNVEKAIGNLKRSHLLSPQSLKDISFLELASQIKPAGYFNVKAKRLKNFIFFLFKEYGGSLQRMGEDDASHLREKLLGVNGIGPETADSILLYALRKPIFVVDAYTKRILYRHNIIEKGADYHIIQKMFMNSLKPDVKMFNEYHALIVRLGKNYCKTTPLCHQCPLNTLNYSLRYKCQHCHRVLLHVKQRRKNKVGFLCPSCFEQN